MARTCASSCTWLARRRSCSAPGTCGGPTDPTNPWRSTISSRRLAPSSLPRFASVERRKTARRGRTRRDSLALHVGASLSDGSADQTEARHERKVVPSLHVVRTRGDVGRGCGGGGG